MSVLSKFKIRKDLQQQIEKEDEKGGGYVKDDRFLPYYELKFGEKVKVLIVPDTNGNLWKKYATHGPNLKVRGTGVLGCRKKNAMEECPVCQHAFDYLNQSKEQGNDVKLKDEAKRWFPKDNTIMSVLVLEAPFDVPISPDQNEVKLMHLPYAVEGIIKNALAEGQVDEDSILQTPLWIKKTVKKGTQDTPDYSNSYFDYRNVVTDDEIEIFEDSVVEAYDYDSLDAIPETPSEDEAEEWLEKAIDLDAKDKARKASGKGNKGGSDDDDNVPNTKLKSAAERLKAKRAQQSDPEDNADAQESEDDGVPDTPEPEKEDTGSAPKSRAQQLRERLAAAKNK